MKLYSVAPVILCMLFLNTAGQKTKSASNVKSSVNHIDSVVKTITTDTTIIYSTVEIENERGNNNYTINAGYKNGRLVTLQKTNCRSFFTNYSQVFYFDKGEPVLYALQYSTSSRMGSCGQVSVGFYHYLKDSAAFAGIAKSLTSHYTCYGYKLEKPVEKTLFDQIDKMKAILKNRNTTVSLAKKTLPFFACYPLYFNEWGIHESYGF